MSTLHSADARTALMASLLLRYPQAGKEENTSHSVLQPTHNNTPRKANHQKLTRTPVIGRSKCELYALDRKQFFTSCGRTIYDARVMETLTPPSLSEGMQDEKEISGFCGFPALEGFGASVFDGRSSTKDLDMMNIDQPYDEGIFEEFLKIIQNGFEDESLCQERDIEFRYHTPVSKSSSLMNTPALSPARSMDSDSDIIGCPCDVEMNSEESIAQEMFDRFIDIDNCMDTTVDPSCLFE